MIPMEEISEFERMNDLYCHIPDETEAELTERLEAEQATELSGIIC